MKGKMMWGFMAMVGMGTVAMMMYKKKNPNFMNDMMSEMKEVARDTAYKVAYSLDENF